MTTTIGTKLMTITAAAGESYCIDYKSAYTVNILNQTDGNVTVSTKAAFSHDDAISECLILTDNAFYYGLHSSLDNCLYITAENDGIISVVRTDRDAA